jgi:hypothetical protein
MFKTFLLLLFLLTTNTFVFSQKDSTKNNVRNYDPKKLRAVLITEGVIWAGSLVVLNDAWYKGYPRSSFHFFNDNDEWLQMDKCGHAWTSYNIGNFGIKLLRSSGVDRKEAIWYGGFLGALYMLNIEILDGLSKEWGFSPGDFTANTIGAAAVIGEQLAWDEQRIRMKWSFHQTQYPQYNHDQLGTGLTEEMLKDYNGQSYWYSANIYSFLDRNSKFPKWLNVALGYGAEGMTDAVKNLDDSSVPKYVRYRQFYLSLDADLTKIKTKSKLLATIFDIAGVLKIPAPTLEYNKINKFVFHPIYY